MGAQDGTDVVTALLRNRGKLLLLKRSDAVGTYRGSWDAVSKFLNDDPEATARTAIASVTRLEHTVELARSADPFTAAAEGGMAWTVHPFLFDARSRDVTLNEASVEAEWVHPTEIPRRDTVPGLWTAYDRLRPTPESIVADRSHGSAYLSIRALEVLRDEAGLLGAATVDPHVEWQTIREVADELVKARPSMTALGNRIRWVMRASRDERTAARVEELAIDAIEKAVDADRRAANAIRSDLKDRTVLTLSRSGTVLEALHDAPKRVYVAESRPGSEGVDVAERIAGKRTPVTLFADAAFAWVLDRNSVDSVVVGADTILADGSIVNKVGTCVVATIASGHDIPVYVIATADKICAGTEPSLEYGPPSDLYDGDLDIDVENPTFDVTPARHITAYATDRGLIGSERIGEIAEAFRELDK